MRYDGAIRVHVKGSTERPVLPRATIEDLTSPSWRATAAEGELPTAGGGPVAVTVELMDGEHAGWTAHGEVAGGDGIQGTDPFMPGV